MIGTISWPAVLSLVAGASMVPLFVWGWRKRELPGVIFYLGIIASGMLWALSYGVGLTVHDEQLRQLIEIPQWLGMSLAAPFVLGFALEYTGRDQVSRSHWLAGLFGLFLGAFVLLATNPIHSLMWQEYTIESVYGAAAVGYTPQPLLFAIAGLAYVSIGAGILLLLEAAIDGEWIHRRQVALLVVAMVLPGVANIIWLSGVGPIAPLDLTPIAFVAAILLVSYAISVEDLFEMVPAVKRIADRVAIEDLGMAVIVLNMQGRVVTLNSEAEQVFSISETRAFGHPMERVTGLSVNMPPGEFTLESPNGTRRRYRVAVSSIDGSSVDQVGHIVTVRDVTDEHRRRQRLEVLNRVLRHNLRNDATIIEGNARLIDEAAMGTSLESEVGPKVEKILDASEGLIDASKKARDVARALNDPEPDEELVDVQALIEDVLAELPRADVRVHESSHATVLTDRRLLRIVLENLLENAIVHGAAPIDVRIDKHEGMLTISVVDEGPGIPEHELEVLRREEEDTLEHGSGLGLWIISWGISVLGGDVDFEVSDGTLVSISLPAAEGAKAGQTAVEPVEEE